jgi:hypothetical protein
MDLTDDFERANLALFLGADLPSEVTDLPSRTDLARVLAHRHGLGESLSLAEVAQRVARGGNRWDFTTFIRDQLDTTGKSPQPFHCNIVKRVQEHGIETLITTAYDNLLELAFQEAGVPINRVVRGSDVSFIDPDRPTLIKLYGDAQQPDTLVVTEDDHYGLGRDREKEDLLHEVRTALRRQTVLFLGYNLADPDFNLLWREVLDRAGRFNRTAYAVWPGLPQGEVQMWQDRGIAILDTDPLGISSELGAPSPFVGRSEPQVDVRQSPIDTEVIKRLRRIEEKLDQGRIEDRRAADQILDALARDRVDQAEITQMVAELRSWVQAVQQAGLPLNPEMREALDALSEHQGSAYQYLQFALPIIPGILSYNVELGSEHKLDLKSLWERVRSRVGRKEAKGDGAASSSVGQVLNTGQAWAVLVGINHYEDPHIADLQVCVDDVTAIHHSLDAGYRVAKLLTDATGERLPTRANILGELSIISQTAAEGDLLLFYFSGHGVAESGESYLLARDTRVSALKHTAVSMRDVRELLELSPARAKVMVLDACHSGASIGKAEPTMTPEFIRRVFEEAEGMAVLASCKQGQKSWEWREKGRSVFTYYLLEALSGRADLGGKKGFVTVSDISRYVTNGVKIWAADRGAPQTPTLQYTVAGDIILVYYK